MSMVKLSMLHSHPLNPRGKEFGDLKGLAESIKTAGLKSKIICMYRNGDEHYVVLDGHRRLAALALLGDTAISEEEIEIREDIKTDDEAVNFMLILNLQREELPPLERATAIARLIGKDSNNIKLIAHTLGKTPAEIERTVAMLRAPKQLKALLAKGKINQDVVSLFGTFPVELQQNLLGNIRRWGKSLEKIDIDSIMNMVRSEGLKLSKVPWKLDDGTLPGGACAACLKKTDSSSLFNFGEGSQCLDATCFEKKIKTHMEKITQEAIKRHYKDQPPKNKLPVVLTGNIMPSIAMSLKETSGKNKTTILTSEEVRFNHPNAKETMEAVVITASGAEVKTVATKWSEPKTAEEKEAAEEKRKENQKGRLNQIANLHTLKAILEKAEKNTAGEKYLEMFFFKKSDYLRLEGTSLRRFCRFMGWTWNKDNYHAPEELFCHTYSSPHALMIASFVLYDTSFNGGSAIKKVAKIYDVTPMTIAEARQLVEQQRIAKALDKKNAGTKKGK